MKSIFILAALLLSFQVKSQTAQLNSWELDELSTFSYQNIEAADLVINTELKLVELHLITERGLLTIGADILYTKKNNCGAEMIVSATRSGEEIVITNFSHGHCAQVLGKGKIVVQYKVFERKSLHPMTDVFYAQDFKTQAQLNINNAALEQIQNRENLAVRRLDERLRLR